MKQNRDVKMVKSIPKCFLIEDWQIRNALNHTIHTKSNISFVISPYFETVKTCTFDSVFITLFSRISAYLIIPNPRPIHNVSLLIRDIIHTISLSLFETFETAEWINHATLYAKKPAIWFSLRVEIWQNSAHIMQNSRQSRLWFDSPSLGSLLLPTVRSSPVC